MNERTHISDTSSCCIHLIFTSQPNLVIKSGAYPSLIKTVTIRLSMLSLIYTFITLLHTAAKFGTIKINTDHLRRAISQLNWDKAFSNTKVTKIKSLITLF